MQCLFENYEQQPYELKILVEEYFSKPKRYYEDTTEFWHKCNNIGYTFDAGLDNEPYGLRPINISIDEIEF
jgi:hypothetical protein